MAGESIFRGMRFVRDDRIPEGWTICNGANGTWSAVSLDGLLAWGHMEGDEAVLDDYARDAALAEWNRVARQAQGEEPT